ncbi:hypothetical protein J1N35_022281 [Gossypium stocksii]|uniref:Uncharacterized protein n=1 Tax=Gossypium stocksii TaxID=47602 RepID=A0A9D3VFU2_9ROSI|nr:hypothetical protein J1N35_022281 [Gossypium stocksii]
MGDVKERIGDVDDRLIDGLQKMKEQLREYVWDTIGSSENKLAEKNDALKAMVTALKEEISELKEELKIFKVGFEAEATSDGCAKRLKGQGPQVRWTTFFGRWSSTFVR